MSELYHYGVSKKDGAKVGSGRYPLGSGEDPYQHADDLINEVERKRKEGFTYTDPKDGKTYTGDTAIAKSMGMSTSKFRPMMQAAIHARRKLDVEKAKALRAEGKSLNQIAEIMGYANDSSVRSLLNEDSERRMNAAETAYRFIKEQIDTKGMVEVGKGVNRELNISEAKMDEALYMLQLEGYPVYSGRVEQMTNPGKHTTFTVIGPPGTQHRDIYDLENVHSLTDYTSHDGGETFDPKWVYPASMDSNRLQVKYAEEGGINKDGTMLIRRNVPDLDLGENHYAQVRIMVDGTHYLKGMAMYGADEDFPDGVDVIFNTNKHEGTPALGPKGNTVLKPIKKDPNNPFGSLIKEGVVDPDDPDKTEGGQSYYIDKDGKKKLSLINKRAEEGDWGEWADKIPAQFLSKQSIELINRQLNLTLKEKESELNEIESLTNPTVKKALLYSFADDCDAAAVHLKAAALPRQKYQVILPLESISEKEVYAPQYADGETVALIRYPHGGTFEIPILKVNNKQEEGKKYITNEAKDAVGINSKVAERLSGADFDGDTVMVIPCNSYRTPIRITSTEPLEGLVGFDAKMVYGGKEEGTYKRMTEQNTQRQMGMISNLITDMTIGGADEKELARAVRHSMVVIDAEKHGLDWQQSEKDNGIKELRKKYQGYTDETGKERGGASTLISRARNEVDVPKRRGNAHINPETGEKYYNEVYEEYTDKKGKTHIRTQKSTQMAETNDAHTLSTGSKQEEAYAEYANAMKRMANQARKEYMNTKDIPYSPSANKVYHDEVETLKAKVALFNSNKPRERTAQMMANSELAKRKAQEPGMSKKDKKKLSQQFLAQARVKVGASRKPVPITPKEWEAIQAGAITTTLLKNILEGADKATVKQYAMPRQKQTLSDSKIALGKSMKASGYTMEQIAQRLGVSRSTVNKYI